MNDKIPAASGAAPASLSKTDIARIWRRVTGGVQFQPHEYVLLRAIADEAAALASREASPATLTDEQVREAFRASDSLGDPMRHRTPWQVWRDAFAAFAALASPQVDPAHVKDSIDWPDDAQIECWRAAADTLLQGRRTVSEPDLRHAAFQLQNAYLFASSLRATPTPVAPQDDARDAAKPAEPGLNAQIREVVEYHEGQHRFSPLKHSPDPMTRAGWKKQMDAIEAVLDALPEPSQGEQSDD